eukprot:TRINITY_DN74423_c0_g1_i1.p1 TRINITY_DN74423_c0_g1~~TRINITY_DN74423_c0_g1_i1.p1  ORF type:complete len:500 (-),score=74.60 TRINITY_DN74423_c0_g1_i1:96-1595(-)
MGQRVSTGVSDNLCCSAREKHARIIDASSTHFGIFERLVMLDKLTHVAFSPLYGEGSSPKRLALGGVATAVNAMSEGPVLDSLGVDKGFVSDGRDDDRDGDGANSTQTRAVTSGAVATAGDAIGAYATCSGASASNSSATTVFGSVLVFRIVETTEGEAPDLELELELPLGLGQEITGLMWSDETTSRYLVVASGQRGGERPQSIRVVPVEFLKATSLGREEWKEKSLLLDDRLNTLTCMVAIYSYIVAADVAGECRVWRKNRPWTLKKHAMLHEDGIADMSADRLFLYTVGLTAATICAWTIPELEPAITVAATIPRSLFFDSPLNKGESTAKGTSMCRLERLTGIRRPQSRWAGTRIPSKLPTGAIYVTGVLADGQKLRSEGDGGAGILTEWVLGAKAVCHAAQIAHATPISALVYGPYDNGPLITADWHGEFRVWDIVNRLTCVQTIDLGTSTKCEALRVSVEPFQGLFATLGDQRLLVWRRAARTVEFRTPEEVT